MHDIEYTTVNETCEALKISRFTVYRLVESGALASIMIGRARRISVPSIRDYIAKQVGGAS